MPRDTDVHQPWNALKPVLSSPDTESSTNHHPGRRVLRDYVADSLPERPAAWTRTRAEALAAGTLRDWTRWEVAVHVANCTKCLKRIASVERGKVRMQALGIASLIRALRQPRWAPIGWALAGTQAVALASLLLWTVLTPSIGLVTLEPQIDLALNHYSQNHVAQSQLPPITSAVWVEFDPAAPWEEVTMWLQSLELEVRGPDAEGLYVVLGEEIETDELAQSPWVLQVHTPTEVDHK